MTAPIQANGPAAAGRPARIFISAGEESGDLHASNLIKQARALRPGIEFEGFGGSRMAAAGCRMHADILHLSAMGISFLGNLFAFIRLIRLFHRLLRERPPDVLVLVDYPGFHFILARLAKRRGLPVIYYICPQIWAWAPWRRRKILRLTDLLMVILPFEQEFYRAPGHQVVHVGHPLGDVLAEKPSASRLSAELRAKLEIPESASIIGLFPGSRSQEVRQLVPLFHGILEKMDLDPGRHRIAVSCCREGFREEIEAAFAGFPLKVDLLEGDAHPLMAACDFALVASGTATLELAYYQKPMVVLYKIGRLSHLVYRWICTSPFVALVNILGRGEVVPEDVTYHGEAGKHAARARALLLDTPERAACIQKLRSLKDEVFRPGASRKAAVELCRFLDGKGRT